jgi:hypothetical protein
MLSIMAPVNINPQHGTHFLQPLGRAIVRSHRDTIAQFNPPITITTSCRYTTQGGKQTGITSMIGFVCLVCFVVNRFMI